MEESASGLLPSESTDPPEAPSRGHLPAEAVDGAGIVHEHTRGDPELTVGVVEGPPELAHPCFAGADVDLVDCWWLPSTPPTDIAVEHGTYVASMLFGQPDSPFEGLAPHCRGRFAAALTDDTTVLDPINTARAFEELIEAGADIIHFSAAHPTLSNDTHHLLKRAIDHAERADVLVVAPAGNDYGECDVAPAFLHTVLAVGAHRRDGTVFGFSNWGPAYEDHGIVAPGEDVLGATPAGGVRAHKGTSVAAPLVTGAAALLMSLRRHSGLPADPLAVRDLLLATARPCPPDDGDGDGDGDGERKRCLLGRLDLAAAARRILAQGAENTGHPGLARSDGAALSAVRLASTSPAPTGAPALGEPARPQKVGGATLTTLAHRPELAAAPMNTAACAPEFLRHDLVGQWDGESNVAARFADYAVVAVDAAGEIAGRGWALPFRMAAPLRGHLPDRGWDQTATWALCDVQAGVEPDTLALVALVVSPDHSGDGLGEALVTAVKDIARTAGLREVVAAVRPAAKHREPETPMAAYARRTQYDGLPADPWLRVHVRAGGHIAAIAPASITVSGSLAQWRSWTGLPFDTAGPVTVPGALAPVHCLPAQDHAAYVEPHVWVRHPLG